MSLRIPTSAPSPPTPAALMEWADRIRAIAAGRTDEMRHLVHCPDCNDTRWRHRLDDRTVTPCRRCHPIGYRRWRERHWASPNGDLCRCEECALAQHGELKVGRDIDPVTGDIRPGVLRNDP